LPTEIFVDADDARRRRPGPSQLFPHGLFFEFLDGVPVEVQFVRHLSHGGLAASASDGKGEPLGVERIVGEPVETFVLHALAPGTEDPAECEVEVDPLVAAREIADASGPLVVVGVENLSADAAGRFF